MKTLSVTELHKMIVSKEDFQLIDVREIHEFEEANMNGTLIPLGEIVNRKDEISREKKVIIHCKSGKRSATAIKILETQHNYDNLYNLEGGILAWKEEYE